MPGDSGLMAPYADLIFDLPVAQVFTYQKDNEGLAVPGKRVMAPFGSRDLTGYVIGESDTLPPGLDAQKLKQIRRVVDKEVLFGKDEIDLSLWIAGYYLCGQGEALAAMIPSGRRIITNELLDEGEDFSETNPELSEEQDKALNAILKAPEGAEAEGGGRPFYLYGITGSGKTEVFLKAAEAVLAEGKSVIYLVPEISLTHQTALAIERRFGTVSATLHSGMSPGARLAEWMRIRRGEVRIVVGPRSAVFAPLVNLGLIIIDEEHDSSYKSGSTPRYHARQVAMRRAAVSGAKLIMGSATPSVEAWKLMEEGKIKKLSLTRRLSGGSLPEIIPVSLEHSQGCLTPLLKEEIRLTARLGRQTILFLNRRGFAYFYHCPSCGYELSCRQCSVSLTYYKSRNRAVCHYCGYSTTPPESCPQCGSLEAGFTGFGTEMIEEEVRNTFPELRILRADGDTSGRGRTLKEILEKFKNKEIDILLGTQMVAKGLNFPGVRLVGVVQADTGLHLPDFRAAERTFALLVQVAGRAGRYFPDGKVIVQTLRPRDPTITKACAMDVEGFFSEEIRQREVLGFPPHSRLIRITFRSKDQTRAERESERMAAILEKLVPKDGDILGPAECPIGIIAGNHRRHIIIRGRTMGPLHGAVRTAVERFEAEKDSRVYMELDVDPVSIL
jgi:primosomal protein N' (replication factor Y)